MKPAPSYKESGTGPLVLFLHGLGGNRHAFDRQFEHLTQNFRCAAWDVPGYGDSEPMDEMTFPTLVEHLQRTIDALNEAPYAIVGHSLGGMVAQSWLAAGGQTEKLILAQTSARFGKPGSEFNENFLNSRLQPILDGQSPSDFAEALIIGMFHNKTLATDIAAGVATMAPLPATVYQQAIECLVTFDELEQLSKISVPTLCLAAEHDTTAPPKNMQAMSEQIPGAEFIVIPAAGHLAYLEQSEQFTACISEFLA